VFICDSDNLAYFTHLPHFNILIETIETSLPSSFYLGRQQGTSRRGSGILARFWKHSANCTSFCIIFFNFYSFFSFFPLFKNFLSFFFQFFTLLLLTFVAAKNPIKCASMHEQNRIFPKIFFTPYLISIYNLLASLNCTNFRIKCAIFSNYGEGIFQPSWKFINWCLRYSCLLFFVLF